MINQTFVFLPNIRDNSLLRRQYKPLADTLKKTLQTNTLTIWTAKQKEKDLKA